MDHSRLIGSIHNIQLHEGVQNNNFIGKKRDWNPSPLHSYQQTHQKDTVPQFYKCFGHLGHAFWINILRIRERKRARCLFWYPHLKVLTCTFAKWYLYMASRFTLHILNLPKVPSFPSSYAPGQWNPHICWWWAAPVAPSVSVSTFGSEKSTWLPCLKGLEILWLLYQGGKLKFVPMLWDWNLIRYDVLFEKGFGLG